MLTSHFDAINGGQVFLGTDPPDLQIVDYYFASQLPYFTYITNALDYSPDLAAPPFPGAPSFSPTNAQPALIAPFGRPFTIAGWAKMAIANGYAGKCAYLEQYWDKAYKIGANGAPVAETGVLSPYGEFFPTEPGPTALVTMPDVDTGRTGTGVVNVIKLQLDVNHDGTNDLTLGGPDNTSPGQPFLFWVNNDADRPVYTQMLPLDEDQDDLETNPRRPDYDYNYRRSYGGPRAIPCARDLEDFARLWIRGVTSNLVASLPPGSVGELSWGDKDSPSTNNPAIDFFIAQEPGGGMAYLTNGLVAGSQTNASLYPCIGTLGPGGSIIIFSNNWALTNLNLIWCGAKAGSGALTLTVKQGTNKIAETYAYIEIKDIKKMYERWTAGDNPKVAPTNRPYLASNGLPTNAPPFKYSTPSGTNTPYILFVHDYDLPQWKKDCYAETAFKRLYWQGYQGRFGLFRWPSDPEDSAAARRASEFSAWRSGTGLLNLLTNLNAQYPGNVYVMAHGYGTIAAGEALRLAGTNNFVVNTYVAMQGAVPAHAYSYATPRALAPSVDDHTPNRYLSYYTNATGAQPYFPNVGGADVYINYFNTNDWLLTGKWRNEQDAKPDVLRGYHWDGTNFYRYVFPNSLLLLFPADAYEIFSYCDEARCEAIGAQPSVAGAFRSTQEVDLSAPPYNFGDLEKYHSAQFLSDAASRWKFWDAVMKSMGLKQ